MSGVLGWIRRFIQELRRRRVIRVAVVYAGTGFVILEAADILQPALRLPSWTVRLIAVLLILGFPLAVGLAWVYNITEEGVLRIGVEEEAGKVGPDGKPFTSDVVIIGLLVLIAGLLLYPRLFSSGEEAAGQGSPARADTARVEERSIAVLPFEVSGAGADEWRDGMVTMLSAGLDGAAGLRAVADRTVFARWEEALGSDESATQEEAVSVARTIGSRYAIVGSAGVLGEDLRFLADVYETNSGTRLGKAQVRGSPDSVTALTDRLTREILSVLLERSEEAIPSVDLASVTTESLEVLKAYLAGEQHFRAGEHEAAIDDYETAVGRDSTFALAYARLDISTGWASVSGGQDALKRAYRLSDRLPSRERRLVRARYINSVVDDPMAAADTLRRLTGEYPDDPSVWYQLGEALWHGFVPRGWPEAERAFQRAVELDPGVAPYHVHLVDLAFSLHRDSALAARRIAGYTGGRYKNMFEAVWDVTFGPPGRRANALDHLDEVWPYRIGGSIFMGWPLLHPADLNVQGRVLRTLEDNIEPGVQSLSLARNHFLGGRIEKALALLQKVPENEEWAGSFLAMSHSLGYPLPDSTLHSHLGPSQIEESTTPRRLLCAGLSLAEKDREEELSSLIAQLREAGTKRDMSEPEMQQLIDELNGYQAFKARELKRAVQLWSGHNESWYWGAIWRGDLYRDLGDLETAEGWYLAGWMHPLAHQRLGQLYEKMGTPEKARAAYGRFVEAWKNADAELQGRVEKARRRLADLEAKADAASATDSKSNP